MLLQISAVGCKCFLVNINNKLGILVRESLSASISDSHWLEMLCADAKDVKVEEVYSASIVTLVGWSNASNVMVMVLFFTAER